MISVRPAVCGKNFNAVTFSNTINMKSVKLCMFLVLTELFLPFHTSFSDLDSSDKQFLLKNLRSYPIKLKLCMITDYIQ